MKKLAWISLCVGAVLLASCGPYREAPARSRQETGMESAAAAASAARARLSASSSQTAGIAIPSTQAPDSSAVTAAELADAKRTFQRVLSDVQDGEPSRVSIEITDPSGTRRYSSADSVLIAQWVELLQSMEFKALPFIPVSGIGFGLNFTCGGEDVSVAGFVDQYVYVSSQRVMFLIEDYDAQRDKVSRLVARMQNT